ncbi:hypothetical protein Tco_1284555 [Tanacetum coccineum]
MNEPNEENSMLTDNVRGETFEEHDIYMNELLKSLKAADKDGITEDLFISVEKHVERLVKSKQVLPSSKSVEPTMLWKIVSLCGNEAVFICRKTQRSLRTVPTVPDISEGRQACKGAAQ